MFKQQQNRHEHGFQIVTTVSQSFSDHRSLSQIANLRGTTALPKTDLAGKQHDQETAEYRILISYNRPEFGEDVDFLFMYHVRENKDEELLRQIFTKAFERAHPSWTIKEVTIEMNPLVESSRIMSPTVQVIVPEETTVQT